MLKAITPLALAACAATAAHAQSITFSHEGGVITSMHMENLVFDATQEYEYGAIQFRLLDLFPDEATMGGTFFDPTSVSFAINGVSQPLSASSQFGVTSPSTGGGANLDATFWITFSDSITIAPGDTITLSGNTLATSHLASSLPLPMNGSFDGYFHSSATSVDGILTETLGTTIAIPEPSTYALISGISLLSLALLRRRRAPH